MAATITCWLSLNLHAASDTSQCLEVGLDLEVGLGAMQMAERGSARGWGLGRHVLGSNLPLRARPWGSYSEFKLRDRLHTSRSALDCVETDPQKACISGDRST